MKNLKHQNITISIPSYLHHELHMRVRKRDISSFITEVIEKELKKKKLSLEEQYRLAAEDELLNEEFQEWEKGTIGDGLDEKK